MSGQTLTRSQLSEAVYQEVGLSRNESSDLLESVLNKMAEVLLSPGVLARENDQSFLTQLPTQAGAAIVGPTVKGPAFVPTVVKSFAEYERMFGGLSSETFVPQTVREYLRNAGSVTVCRVLAGGGYSWIGASQSPAILAAGLSGVGASAIESGFISFVIIICILV